MVLGMLQWVALDVHQGVPVIPRGTGQRSFRGVGTTYKLSDVIAGTAPPTSPNSSLMDAPVAAPSSASTCFGALLSPCELDAKQSLERAHSG